MVLLSREAAYDVRSLVTVAPVTTRIRGLSAEVRLGAADGMPRECVVNLDNISTIGKHLLQQFMTDLSQQKLLAVEDAIRFSLGMEE